MPVVNTLQEAQYELIIEQHSFRKWKILKDCSKSLLVKRVQLQQRRKRGMLDLLAVVTSVSQSFILVFT